jgi:hypothetical protein
MILYVWAQLPRMVLPDCGRQVLEGVTFWEGCQARWDSFVLFGFVPWYARWLTRWRP